jgi:hypothetical protein
MQISSAESIRIFGWWDQPHRVLAWSDIKEKAYTWRVLRDDLHFSAQQLHRLQGDKREWIHRGGLRLSDLPELTMFPVNPLVDMRADIGELCSMQWRHETLLAMGVTYQQMVHFGMTPRIMTFFRFPLSGWAGLSLGPDDVAHWSNKDASETFGIEVEELHSILNTRT